jgi:uncharacterized iron-regulated membrane protein
MRKLRQTWVTLHRWIGLGAGWLLCVAGLSGSFLVYYPAIDRALNPDWVTPHMAGPARPMASVIAAAERTAKGRFVHSVFPADAQFPVHRVWLTPSASDQARMWEVLVDPASARVLGERQAMPAIEPGRRNLVNTFYTLHYNLFAGKPGATVVGIVGLFMLVSAGSGLVLWWPRGRKWRQALTFKRGARGHRLHVDLHRVAGAYGSAVLLVVAFTGVCLVFPDYVRALSPAQADEAAFPGPRGTMACTSAVGDADCVMQTAVAAIPGSSVRILWLPGADGPDWHATLREATGIGLAGGKAEVAVDPATGAITLQTSSSTADAATQFLAWQLPLHNGSVLGNVGRLFVFLAGLLPTVLLVTGYLIYRRKRSAARGRHQTTR